jgi:hypothetical protein
MNDGDTQDRSFGLRRSLKKAVRSVVLGSVVMVAVMGPLRPATAQPSSNLPKCTKQRAGQVVSNFACVRVNGSWMWRELAQPTQTAAPSPSGPTTAPPKPVVYLAKETPAVTPDRYNISYQVGAQKISGTTYQQSIKCQVADQGRPCAWEFDLSRKYGVFASTVGHEDKSDANQIIRVEVYVDQRLAWERDVRFGEAIPVNLDVTGALRIRLVAYMQPYNAVNAFLAWGDPGVS